MTNWVNLGGKERPLAFGWDVAYAYETQTGGSYNELIYTVDKALANVRQAAADGDLVAVARATPVKMFTDLVYFGLKHAHINEGWEVDFQPGDVAGWIFSDTAALQACILAMYESLQQSSGGDDAKKKTPGPALPTKSTGKNLSKRQQR